MSTYSGRKRRLETGYSKLRDDICPPLELALIVHDKLVEGYCVAAVVDIHSLCILAVQMLPNNQSYHKGTLTNEIKRKAENLLASEMQHMARSMSDTKQAIISEASLQPTSCWYNLAAELPLHELCSEDSIVLPDYVWIDVLTPETARVLGKLRAALTETAEYTRLYASGLDYQKVLPKKLLELVSAWNATPYAALHLDDSAVSDDVMIIGDADISEHSMMESKCDSMHDVENSVKPVQKFPWHVVQAVLRSPGGMGIAVNVDACGGAPSPPLSSGRVSTLSYCDSAPGKRVDLLDAWREKWEGNPLPPPPTHYTPLDTLSHAIVSLNLLSLMSSRSADGVRERVILNIPPRLSLHGSFLTANPTPIAPPTTSFAFPTTAASASSEPPRNPFAALSRHGNVGVSLPVFGAGTTSSSSSFGASFRMQTF